MKLKLIQFKTFKKSVKIILQKIPKIYLRLFLVKNYFKLNVKNKYNELKIYINFINYRRIIGFEPTTFRITI